MSDDQITRDENGDPVGPTTDPSELSPESEPREQQSSLPEGADVPAWVAHFYGRFDAAEKVRRAELKSVNKELQDVKKTVRETFDALNIKLSERIADTQLEHRALERKVQMLEFTRLTLPVVAITMASIAILGWIALSAIALSKLF